MKTEATFFTDKGLVEKKDHFGIIVTAVCIPLIAILAFLGAMAIMNA